MLYIYFGSDREKVRLEVGEALMRYAKTDVVRITDVHALGDVQSVCGGSNLFGDARTVVLDGLFSNIESWGVVERALPYMQKAQDTFFIVEEKLNAATLRTLKEHAKDVVRFDVKKEERGGEIFALANTLKRKDKKMLWIEYQKALARGEAPEAIHGVLFWGAKDMVLRARDVQGTSRAQSLIIKLTELPHEARRKGVELEYALEQFLLSGV
ncbi:MAG TPA: hypothetical protein VJH33_03235 [Candidatus Paceibacterota bacterium]